ncbi:MAG TPA: hypothetical protein DCZ94_10765 [Lentisphaeria bacterium]|nr:MAG: hypothetical protein A2X48_06645 [Lentisphaerae bacterium GWF2_49_21]HBC87426.1 hypothetical protein [Lentisphaeria bacterium]
MILAYYYLLSSLPLLRKGEQPPITSEYLLSSCSQMLGPKTADWLMQVKLFPEKENPFGKSSAVNKWYIWEKELRNRLAKFRALRLEREYGNGENGNSIADIDRSIEEILSTSNPLEREKLLDALRWRALDGFEFGHDFDFDLLCIYRIKLLLLEKWIGREQRKGLENLDAIVNKLERAGTTASS